MLKTSAACTLPTFSIVERVRTLIVDDHPIFRLALRDVLAREPEFEVSADAGSVAEAIACLARNIFEVAIVDVVMLGARGSAFVEHVRNTQPDCKVLALSAVDDPTQMAEMLRAGASGLALKSQPAAEIVEALRCVLGGGCSVPAALCDQLDKLLDTPGCVAASP